MHCALIRSLKSHLATHGGPGTGEEVVEDGDLVSEQHQSVDQVRTDETGTSGYCKTRIS